MCARNAANSFQHEQCRWSVMAPVQWEFKNLRWFGEHFCPVTHVINFVFGSIFLQIGLSLVVHSFNPLNGSKVYSHQRKLFKEEWRKLIENLLSSQSNAYTKCGAEAECGNGEKQPAYLKLSLRTHAHTYEPVGNRSQQVKTEEEHIHFLGSQTGQGKD